MNAIIFATVGTSALTNNAIGDLPDWKVGPQLRADSAAYLLARARQRHSIETRNRLKERLIDAHRAYWKQRTEDCLNPYNYPKSAAELTSMPGLDAAITSRGQTLRKIVLLTSDTQEGRLASAVVEAVLTTPDCFDLEPARVEVAVVPGLNETFRDQFEHLKRVVETHKSGLGQPLSVYFNFTGGFKATVPFLTRIAMLEGNSLYYQHERRNTSEIIDFARLMDAPERVDETPLVGFFDQPPTLRRKAS